MNTGRALSRPVLVAGFLLLAAPGGSATPLWSDTPSVEDAGRNMAGEPAPEATPPEPELHPHKSLPTEPLGLVSLGDLQPTLLAGRFAEAKRAFDEGRFADSLTAFDRETPDGGVTVLPPEARFVRAQALVKAFRQAEAGPELETLAELLPLLRSRCVFGAAGAREDQKQFAAAAELYGRVAPDSPLHRDAVLGDARVRTAIGSATELDTAAELLKPLAALPPPLSGFGRDLGSEASFSLAQLAQRRGRTREAARRYRELWLTHPLAQLAEPAGAEAIKLGAPPGTPAQLVARAEIVLAANRNQSAIDALTPLAKQLHLGAKKSLGLACQAHFDLAKALKKQRRHTEALAEFGRVLEVCVRPGDAELRARALYLSGQSAAVIDPPKAKRLFGELTDRFPHSSFADDALFFAADVAAKSLNDRDAAAHDLNALVERYPDGDYATEARFRLFWMALQDGSAAQGTGQLEQILASAPSGAPREPEPIRRARYWLAHSGDNPVALAAMSATWPADYYGDLAATAAGSPPRLSPGGACPAALESGSLGTEPAFRAGILLLRMGLGGAADEELSSVDRRAISGPTGRVEPLLLLALALTQAGDARVAHAIAKSLIEQPGASAATVSREERDQLLRLLFQLAYPQAFRPEIERWAAAAKVPPDLLQGLMREESALDPDALSGAGAIGLCQLMPATGKRVARRLGLGEVSVQRLQEPELNIRLGAAYLGELLQRFGGRKPLAVAAYNAGEAAVDRWLAATHDEPLDAFVEDIPISETRNYVKRVLTSEAVYRTLWGPAGK